MKYDYLIIGSGITGSTIARKLAEHNNKVLIIERRNHIGGNMYDYVNEHGILVHKYGPHAFHTKEKELLDFLKQFEDFKEYILRCGAIIKDKYSPTPFNFQTIDDHYDETYAKTLKEELIKEFNHAGSITIIDILSSENKMIRDFGLFLFENDYKPYTSKQWGIDPKDVDISILKRVPVRLSYIDAYYDDLYQYMPMHSYTYLFEKMLDHENIDIRLNTDALKDISFNGDKVLYQKEIINVISTAPIDELFNYCYGKLPYRSLYFKEEYLEIDSYQDAPVVAYPLEKDYTRITEYKKLPYQDVKGTSIFYEYPLQYDPLKDMEAYYPLLTNESKNNYQKYAELSKKYTNLICAGRLGSYAYFNMDDALAQALRIAKEILNEK